MGMVLTDNLRPGMRLAADVCDRNGRMLLGAGSELTDKHIYIFHIWGVIEADISGVEHESAIEGKTDPVDLEAWAAAEAHLRPLFRHTDLTHPIMKQLLNMSIMRRIHH